jgi:hypothetical protein
MSSAFPKEISGVSVRELSQPGIPHRDSVALWATLLPLHPSGTSSERTTSPDDREIGLAGWSWAKKNHPRL